MPADIDEQRLLRAFLEEAEELLEKLNHSLLGLEKDTTNPRLINEIFRLTHSLKSESALLGFSRLGELAHRLEDVFDRIRAGGLSLTRPLMDAVFSAADLVHEMIARISAGQSDADLDTAAVALELASLVEPSSAHGQLSDKAGQEHLGHSAGEAEDGVEPVLGDFQRSQVLEALDRGEEVYRLSCRLSEEAQVKYPRAYLVINKLETIANVIATAPDMRSPADDCQYGRFVVLFSTNLDQEAIRKACAVDLIESIELTALEREAIDQVIAVPADRLRGGRRPAGDLNGPHRGRIEIASVRVDTKKLNEIWQLVGELTIYKAQLSKLHETVAQQQSSESIRGEIERATDSLDRIASQMQRAIMETRMVPIAVLFNKFPRLVRDLSRKLGKNVELEILGQDTEIDRTIVEALSDPLTHIIRNSLDHGVELPEQRSRAGKPEAGRISISACQRGGKIVIEVVDDGQGLDVEKIRHKAGAELSDEEVIQFIFSPGFSTKDDVTDLSGRGVGMDVVATRIRDDLKGEVEVRSERGRGTLIRIVLPLTLTILHSLIIAVGRHRYAIPVQDIDETIRVADSEIRNVDGTELYSYAGRDIPLVRLDSMLHDRTRSGGRRGGEYTGVVIRQAQGRVCLLVDELVDEEDVVIKPISELLNYHRLFSGVSVLGDGRILFILDTARIMELVGSGNLDGG